MKENLKILFLDYLKMPFRLRLFFRLLLLIVAVEITAFNVTVNAQAAQMISVSGTVIDAATGEPLPFVNVVVQGTTIGTSTDPSGKFTLPVPTEQSVLEFSFIGYIKQTVTVGKQRQISVALRPDLKALEEVVVVGYGVQKKESVIGAISQTTGEIVKQNSQGTDLGVALTGSLPGLNILRTGGLPGGRDYAGTIGATTDDDYAYMYIRGQKTWNNSAPLVLVDGVERELYNLDPNEIEKVSLLKDASATSVFGVKGANGVILITTRRGKVGKPMMSVDVRVSAKTLSKVPHREGSYVANTMRNYAILNEVPYNEPAWSYIVPNKYLEAWKNHTYPYYLPDVDWTNEFTKKVAFDQKINLNVSGGTKIVKYFAALAYVHEGDILNIQNVGQGYTPNFAFDRFNFRSNLDFDITPTTRFSTNLSGYYLFQKRPAGDKYTSFFGVYSTPPDLYVPKYSDGTWCDNKNNSFFHNPMYNFDMFGYQMNKQTSLTTDFMLDQKLDVITKGLSASGKLSYDNTFTTSGPQISGSGTITKYIQQQIVDELQPGMTEDQIKALEAKYTYWQTPSGTNSGFDWVQPPNSYSNESASTNTYRKLYYELKLNYLRDIDKHSVTGMVLFSRQQDATGSVFMSYREDWVGRATYTYDKKYILELNGAYNGSEKFGPNYRFGFFPAVGVGWVVSNETFFEKIKSVVSNLKIRYSDGKIGSDAGIARWLYVGSWVVKQSTPSTSSTDVYRFGAPDLQNAYPLRYQGVIPNTDIHWETSHKRDLGIETGFFKDQLKLNFDYFTEDRANIFVSGTDRAVPEYFGAAPVSANLGRVKAWGWEFELNFSRTTPGGFTFWLNHAWSFAKDKIIVRADPPLTPWYQKQAGYQIGQQRVTLNQQLHPMQTWNDIYNAVGGSNNTNLLPGDFCLVDYNSDGIIDNNDQIPYGYPPRPQFSYSPSAGISWKNLSANVRFYGVYNVAGNMGMYWGAFGTQFDIVNPWNKLWSYSPEFNNTTTALNAGLRFTTSANSGYIDNPRSYLRFQHAEVAYILPFPVIKKIGITNFKLTLSGDNIALWTKSKTFDDFDAPQITSEANVRRSYPVLKNFNFGLSFNFQ